MNTTESDDNSLKELPTDEEKIVEKLSRVSLDTVQMKWNLRERIWNLMEEKNLVQSYPRPCHNKIPNFKRCGIAAEKLSKLREFRRSKCVKINPSMAQMHLRFLTLKYGKTLLVPSPALTQAFMYKINPNELKHFWQLKRASSKAGAAELGSIFSVNDHIEIDLYIVASVACSSNGVRLGKGLGYAEIEWAILHTLGCVTSKTVVMTTVHDSQVLDDADLPLSLLSKYDLPVDVIVTPTRVINVRDKLCKPSEGIYWDLITDEQLKNIPVLSQLKKKLNKTF